MTPNLPFACVVLWGRCCCDRLPPDGPEARVRAERERIQARRDARSRGKAPQGRRAGEDEAAVARTNEGILSISCSISDAAANCTTLREDTIGGLRFFFNMLCRPLIPLSTPTLTRVLAFLSATIHVLQPLRGTESVFRRLSSRRTRSAGRKTCSTRSWTSTSAAWRRRRPWPGRTPASSPGQRSSTRRLAPVSEASPRPDCCAQVPDCA